MTEKEMLRISAAMEGEATMLRHGGHGNIKVSKMELMVLVNAAELGALSMFAQLDGEVGERASAELEGFMGTIRRVLGNGDKNGLERLVKSVVAMTRSGRFSRFLLDETTAR